MLADARTIVLNNPPLTSLSEGTKQKVNLNQWLIMCRHANSRAFSYDANCATGQVWAPLAH